MRSTLRSASSTVISAAVAIPPPAIDSLVLLTRPRIAGIGDTATGVTIEVLSLNGEHVEVSTLVAGPGPLVVMKLQAIMNRAAAKQGTDLQDITRLILDEQARPAAVAQLGVCGTSTARRFVGLKVWLNARGAAVANVRWAAACGGTKEPVVHGRFHMPGG
jgi:hypothetical protein